MLSIKTPSGKNNNSQIFIQSNIKIEVFLNLLEEAHDSEKKSDTKFESEVQVGFQTTI